MSDLLTAKDVELKVFKKVRFGGYAVAEVEDFLNQLADDLEAYATQIEEKNNRIEELEAWVKKQESMTDMIKDALIQARKSAKDMEEQATQTADKIVNDAKSEANKIINEADSEIKTRMSDADRQASEIVAKAKISAEDIETEANDKRIRAEQTLSGIEDEIEERRREANDQADDIIAAARSEADRIITDARDEVDEYKNHLKFLNLRKQQFVKNTVSLLFDFGKIIDRAQNDDDLLSFDEPDENNNTSLNNSYDKDNAAQTE